MKKRRKQFIIRYHRFSIDRQPESNFYTELFLFLPWRKENHLKNNFESFRESYEAHKQPILTAKKAFLQYDDLVDGVMQEYLENGPRETDWELISPEIQHENLQYQQENEEIDSQFEHLDTDQLETSQESTHVPTASVSKSCPVTSVIFNQLVSEDEYRCHNRFLNDEQRTVFQIVSTGAKMLLLPNKKVNNLLLSTRSFQEVQEQGNPI